MNSKKKILQKGPEEYKDHREDFATCPTCGHKEEHEKWSQNSHTLCLIPAYMKVDSVTVISKCSKCDNDSWVHVPMHHFHGFSDWPKSWQKAVQKHEAKVRLVALRNWGASLCWNCKNLESAKVDYRAYRYCMNGSSGPAVTECEHYKKYRNNI
jgi:hypothetical protein